MTQYRPPPTIERFMLSNARWRAIMGPFGSGKSSGCCMEIVKRAAAQRQGPDGYRRSRWAVVRNTAPQLRDTTLKTWLSWFPSGSIGYWRATERVYYIQWGDVRAEVMFRALDDANDVRNLLSLELTGAWLNECREIPQEIVEAMDGRISRYPAVKDGGQTWCGMWGDTNPPTEYTYWYSIFEQLDPETGEPMPQGSAWEVFKQPSGLSPEAENLEWLAPGYYADIARGKTADFVRVNVHGKYGRSRAGKPVHPTFDPSIHVAKDYLVPNPRLKLVIAADFGLTPAMTLKQQNAFGQVLTLDEIVTENMGLDQCIKNRLKPLLRNKYQGYDIFVTGDPSGSDRAQTDEATCVRIFKKNGFARVKMAYSNNTIHRIGATDSFLSRLTEAGPAYLIDPRCSFLKRGMSGGYYFPKNQKGETSESVKKNIFSHVCEAGQYGDMYFERGGDTKASRTQKEVQALLAQQQRYGNSYATRR